jgi:hypothetical protein
MMSATSQKRSAADSSHPLQQAGILQHVLDYVGPGHWCFVAEVSSLWRDVYSRLASTEMPKIGFHDKITCVPQMTLYSAVFACPARVRLAAAREVRCTALYYQHVAGMCADVATLEAAHELGMHYTHAVMRGAARCNELAVVQLLRAQGCPWDSRVFELAAATGHTDMCAYLHAEHCPWSAEVCTEAARHGYASALRWLHEHGCPWDAGSIHIAAAAGGSVDMIVYLQQQGIVFTAEMLTSMLSIAGAYSKLAVAQWLRQQGAEWPARLSWYAQQWSDEALVWARAEGCASPTNRQYYGHGTRYVHTMHLITVIKP